MMPLLKLPSWGLLEPKTSHGGQIDLATGWFSASFQEGEAVLGNSLLLPSQTQIQMYTCLTELTNQFLTD